MRYQCKASKCCWLGKENELLTKTTYRYRLFRIMHRTYSGPGGAIREIKLCLLGVSRGTYWKKIRAFGSMKLYSCHTHYVKVNFVCWLVNLMCFSAGCWCGKVVFGSSFRIGRFQCCLNAYHWVGIVLSVGSSFIVYNIFNHFVPSKVGNVLLKCNPQGN